LSRSQFPPAHFPFSSHRVDPFHFLRPPLSSVTPLFFSTAAGYADGAMQHWDMMMRKTAPYGSIVPVLYCRGNHELWNNFTAYKTRLGDSQPLAIDPATGIATANNGSYYSLRIGPSVHLTTFNSETALDTADIDPDQLTWLKADLTAARANSSVVWLLAGAHRPLYCTNDGGKGSDCGTFAGVLRGLGETAFVSSKTDLVAAAHMHGYERTYPVNNLIPSGTSYNSPAAPVYIVNGGAGNREGNENPSGNQPWSAPGAHFGDIGFGLMTIIAQPGVAGGSSLNYQYIRSADGAVLDNFTITK
jgi:hypothetical protein